MDNTKGKTVLILGNGFDLAHGLPTRYSDFLNFCKCVHSIYRYYQVNRNKTKYERIDWIEKFEIDDFIKNLFYTVIDKIRYKSVYGDITINKELDDLFSCIENNIWYDYIIKVYLDNKTKGENWIDFESEISYIIQTIDEYTPNLTYTYEMMSKRIDVEKIEDEEKMKIFSKYLEPNFTIKEVRKNLYDDLIKIIQALEIYLTFIEQMPINKTTKDIADYYDYVINFNYTHTYRNVYGNCKDFFHIHGELKHNPNNMVLGIDEYWSKEERDNHTNFTVFKKFAQRIQKRTGISSHIWFQEIKKDYDNEGVTAEIFIFGHSLDVTDKDILYDYLESEATSVTIYCKDKETEGEYIANVIKIIGEKRLLEKVNQDPPKLRFVLQSDMVERTDIHESDSKDLTKIGK